MRKFWIFFFFFGRLQLPTPSYFQKRVSGGIEGRLVPGKLTSPRWGDFLSTNFLVFYYIFFWKMRVSLLPSEHSRFNFHAVNSFLINLNWNGGTRVLKFYRVNKLYLRYLKVIKSEFLLIPLLNEILPSILVILYREFRGLAYVCDKFNFKILSSAMWMIIDIKNLLVWFSIFVKNVLILALKASNFTVPLNYSTDVIHKL